MKVIFWWCRLPSATQKGSQKYLEETAMRDFILYETKSRVTDLVFKNQVFALDAFTTHWFLSSPKRRGMACGPNSAHTAKSAESTEPGSERWRKYWKFNLYPTSCRGVGMYGRCCQKKNLVEMAFRERILDVVVGTDALSLGGKPSGRNRCFRTDGEVYWRSSDEKWIYADGGASWRKGLLQSRLCNLHTKKQSASITIMTPGFFIWNTG